MLSRLSLNLTQVCNLGCNYCYAKGGDYGGPSQKMNVDVAIRRLEEASVSHREIKLIQFFGGEPLLNYEPMLKVVEATKKLVTSGILEYEPKFGIVTNLTVLKEEALEILRTIKCDVVVSIDGPPKIHDALRSTKKGRPTHSIIMKNLSRLKRAGIPFDIEATYTKKHLDFDVSVVDLLQYFSPFGANVIQIANAADKNPEIGFATPESQDKCISSHLEALEFSIDRLLQGELIPYGLLREMLQSLSVVSPSSAPAGERKNYCTAGTTNLAVSSDGKYYACHMFTNMAHHEVSVDSEAPRTSITNRDDHSQCKACWARHWCTACVGNFEILSSGKPRPYRTHCEITRQGLARVLSRFGAIPSAANKL